MKRKGVSETSSDMSDDNDRPTNDRPSTRVCLSLGDDYITKTMLSYFGPEGFINMFVKYLPFRSWLSLSSTCKRLRTCIWEKDVFVRKYFANVRNFVTYNWKSVNTF